MSRLCRLKTASHGEDGKWAYEEIIKMRQQRDDLMAALEDLIELCTPSFCECEPDVGYQCRACHPSSVVKAAHAAIARVKETK